MSGSAIREDHAAPAASVRARGSAAALSDAVLHHIPLGVLFVDAGGTLLPPVPPAIETLFPGRDGICAHFDTLLRPYLADKALQALFSEFERARHSGQNQPQDVEIRLPKRDGSASTAYYRFEFIALTEQAGVSIVHITDRTLAVQQTLELKDLRGRLQIQTEILRSVLQTGHARFAASVRRTDAAMTAINAILKKPAREPAAFRNKLDETLTEVDRIRRESAALKLSSLESAARLFEDSLHELRGRATLSGSDFLPLAVKLDELFGHFADLRLLMKIAKPEAVAAGGDLAERVTDNGTQIIDAPNFIAMMRAAALPAPPPRRAPEGTLESTLSALADHIGAEHGKAVTLHCSGLQQVPPEYLSVIKHIAIQLIRNALVHGIEAPPARAAAGKPAVATLRLSFESLPDASYELRFEDNGRGVDPQLVLRTAVARQLITPEAAALLTDRHAVKLIFKAGYTTLSPATAAPARGAGLCMVRRKVHEAGGTIAVASTIGRDTRFKINLPAVAALPQTAGP